MDEEEFVLCPVHLQRIKVETDVEQSDIHFAVCTCQVDGKNPYAGKQVWVHYGVLVKQTRYEKPVLEKAPVKKENRL